MSASFSLDPVLQSLSREELIAVARAQAESIAALGQEVERLARLVEELQRRLDDEQGKPPRSAAPFRIPEAKRSSAPKKPGRPKGHPGSYRARPEVIDEEVAVPLPHCPQCGGPVHGVQEVEQFIEELPPVRPRVTRLVTYEGECPQCGPVRSTHPLQVSTASGAAAVQLGPRALGAALELRYTHHLTTRKTCAVLRNLLGLRLSPGGLTQIAHRLADKLRGGYEALAAAARQAAVQHADETSWWVGGPGWWLWVFTDPSQTLYRVRSSRGRDVIYETLGERFPGVLVSDCLNIYDDVSPRQHKCYAHHLKAIAQAIEKHPRQGEGFLRDLRAVLQGAIGLKKARDQIDPAQYDALRRGAQQTADRLLASPRLDAGEESVANRLRKQRDHLFVFLDQEPVPATNNQAERQLRPAVIARKVSCGNKTPRGAHTWEILASLAATAHQARESLSLLVQRVSRLSLWPQPR